MKTSRLLFLGLLAALTGACATDGDANPEQPGAVVDGAPASRPDDVAGTPVAPATPDTPPVAVAAAPATPEAAGTPDTPNPFTMPVVTDPLGGDGIVMRPVEPAARTDDDVGTPGTASRPLRVRPARPERAPGVTQGEMEAVLAQMDGDLRHGDYESVLRRSDELIARTLSAAERQRLEPPRMAARQHLIQTLYIDGIIRLDHAPVSVGEALTGELVLVNLSPDTVTVFDVGPEGRVGTRSVIRIQMKTVEYAVDGTIVHDEQASNAVIGEDIVLQPNERRAFPLRLDTAIEGAGGASLRAVDIQATLYPARLTSGENVIPGNIRFRSRRAFVLPRNWEHLANDPIARLKQALAKRSPPHIPVAAALVEAGDRLTAMAIIRDALRDHAGTFADGPTRAAACIAAAILTGEDGPPDPEHWLKRLDSFLR